MLVQIRTLVRFHYGMPQVFMDHSTIEQSYNIYNIIKTQVLGWNYFGMGTCAKSKIVNALSLHQIYSRICGMCRLFEGVMLNRQKHKKE